LLQAGPAKPKAWRLLFGARFPTIGGSLKLSRRKTGSVA
jgi:hypothetical protein